MNGAAPEPPEPYIGPRPFRTEDSHLFFGRDREKHEVSSLVLANKFLLLYAASGTGKTSLVNAGVLPLVGGKLEVWPTVRFQGAPEATRSVENVYTHAVLSQWAEPDERSQLAETTLADFLADHPPQTRLASLPVPRLLIFDQFEELFTTHPNRWPQRQAFLEQLTEASDADPDLRVLIVMREDFMSRLLGFYDTLHRGPKDRYFLEPLRQPAAELAIRRPLEGTSRSFAPDAVEHLIKRLMTSRVDLGGATAAIVQGEFVEPVLLQVVCQTLWSVLPNSISTISRQDVDKFADVDTALARFYSDAVQKAAALGYVTEAQIREWFQENLLTHPGGTRAAVNEGPTTTKGMPNQVVKLLEGTLLRGEWRAGSRWLEITHDSLLRPIERSNSDFFRATFASADTALAQGADALAAAVKDQWNRAAFEAGLQPKPIPLRWKLKSQLFASSPTAAAGPGHFPALPGLPGAGRGRRQDGGPADLLPLYGGLGSGRVVITGAPGSGKTATAVLLVLTVLAYREQVSSRERALVPVPVMFTLSGWDPYTQRIDDWVTARLKQTYPVFQTGEGAAQAAELMRTGRVAVILDGFDQIPAELRPVALRALSQQAVFRLVLLGRTEEMAAAFRLSILDGAVEIELQDIDSATAAGYLAEFQSDEAQTGMQELINRLHHDARGPLAEVLSNPATLTLVRDAFRGLDNARRLLGPADAADHGLTGADIEGLVLDQVLPAAYASRPGEPLPRYQLQTAQRTLSYLATRMNQDATRDLAWWRVPAWTARAPQVIVFGLVLGVVFGAVAGIGAAPAFGLAFGAGAALVFADVFALMNARRRGSRSPIRAASPQRPASSRGSWTPVQVMSSRRSAFGAWLVGGLVVTVVFGLGGRLLFGQVDGHVFRLVGGFLYGLALGLVFGFSQPSEATSPLSPRAFWQQNRDRGLGAGLLGGLMTGVSGGLVFGLAGGLAAGLATAAAIVITAFPDTWVAAVAFGQLALSERTPVRLLRFLEDARERNVLRNVGPVYQFRHPRLQDRLARTGPASHDRGPAVLP
jgi:hypothetical protein